MSKTDLDRVKEDLETMKSAINPGLPYRRESIRFVLAIAFGGLVCLVWALQPYQLTEPWNTFMIAAVIMLPLLTVCVHFAITYKPGTISIGPGDMKRANMNYIPYIFFLLALPFLIWAMRAGAVSGESLPGVMLFFFGVTVTAAAVTEKKQRYMLGISIPMMLLGVAILTVPLSFGVLLGIFSIAGGLVTAAIMSRQLRRSTASHDSY